MTDHDSFLRATPAMVVCMREALGKPISPWDYGASTIASLKNLGWLEPVVDISGGKRRTLYVLSPTGRAALGEEVRRG